MKKSIVFGVLAMFAMNVVSIQTAEAQNPVKKNSTTEKVVKSQTNTVATTTEDEVKATTTSADKEVVEVVKPANNAGKALNVNNKIEKGKKRQSVHKNTNMKTKMVRPDVMQGKKDATKSTSVEK